MLCVDVDVDDGAGMIVDMYTPWLGTFWPNFPSGFWYCTIDYDRMTILHQGDNGRCSPAGPSPNNLSLLIMMFLMMNVLDVGPNAGA